MPGRRRGRFSEPSWTQGRWRSARGFHRAHGQAPLALTGNGRTEGGLTTEQSFMNDNACATADRDALFDAFAAELTRAAYHVALRHGAAGTWLDLQLELWQALAVTVKQWGRKSPPDQVPRGSPDLSTGCVYYSFDIWARWRAGNRVVSQIRHVDVHAGSDVSPDFTASATEQRPASAKPFHYQRPK
jgi:hypothetical protein